MEIASTGSRHPGKTKKNEFRRKAEAESVVAVARRIERTAGPWDHGKLYKREKREEENAKFRRPPGDKLNEVWVCV